MPELHEAHTNDLNFFFFKQKTAYEMHAEEVARIMTEKKVPKISEMFEEAKQVGSFKLIACSAGLEYMSVKYEDFASKVDDVLGLPLILNLAADAETTLFI